MADDFKDIQVTSWFTTLEQELARDLGAVAHLPGQPARATCRWRSTSTSRRPARCPTAGRCSRRPNRPDPRYGNIFVSTSIGEQDYHGLVAVLTKRFSRGHSFQLSYHLSKADGAQLRQRLHRLRHLHVAVGSARPERRSRAVGLRHAAALQRDGAGRAATSTGCPASAGALLNDWQFSTRIIASDGFRFNATTGQDGNGDTVFNDRPAGQTYNSFELPAYVTLDLRFDRIRSDRRRPQLELIVEGFNLTNRLNPTNVNRTWGPNATANANFNTVTGAETARQFQLAARFSF